MQKQNSELNAVASKASSVEWIEEQASVIAIDGDFAKVLPAGQSACSSCTKNSGCSTNAFAIFSTGKKSHLRVLNNLNAREGDEVVIGIPSGTLMMSTALAYGIPLLLLFVVAFLGQVIFSAFGWNAEVGSIVLGGLGLLLGFIISSRLANLAFLFGKRYQPVILSVDGHSVKPVLFRGL